MKNNKYDTLVEAMQDLRRRGYALEFNFDKEAKKMKSSDVADLFGASDLTIVEYHRFEGMSNPSDMSILYGVEAKGGHKGMIVSGYGPAADLEMDEFIKEIEVMDETV